MIQNIIIIVVLVICAWFIGRRLYTNLTKSQGCGCGSDCSTCTTDTEPTCPSSACKPDKK